MIIITEEVIKYIPNFVEKTTIKTKYLYKLGTIVPE